jgi:putative methionine-R-sulfoxide reductase with GAF domain
MSQYNKKELKYQNAIENLRLSNWDKLRTLEAIQKRICDVLFDEFEDWNFCGFYRAHHYVKELYIKEYRSQKIPCSPISYKGVCGTAINLMIDANKILNDWDSAVDDFYENVYDYDELDDNESKLSKKLDKINSRFEKKIKSFVKKNIKYLSPKFRKEINKDFSVSWSSIIGDSWSFIDEKVADGSELAPIVIIPDVSKVKNHIVCDPKSKSEIVIPFNINLGYSERNYGHEVLVDYHNYDFVLDIDSNNKNDFDNIDVKYLSEIIVKSLCPSGIYYSFNTKVDQRFGLDRLIEEENAQIEEILENTYRDELRWSIQPFSSKEGFPEELSYY